MAALHSALQALSPVEFTSLPLDDLKPYLVDMFSKSQVLIDSVPLAPTDSTPPTGRSRANTTSSLASNASEMSSSSARSAPPVAEHAALQKEWGKPVKLSAKENPLGIAVYKLAGRDGKGAWFARRSVHEGLGFAKWRAALEREFPESLEVQGGPGEGNVRGIGGERRVERKMVPGVGKMEVYHLSAQFPGPTTPRDFVTLLLTSPAALIHANSSPNLNGHLTPNQQHSNSALDGIDGIPRHYMVISKPCLHPDCPPREGFVRGEYESIEFIREVPVHPPSSGGSASNSDQQQTGRRRSSSLTLAKETVIRNATKSQTFHFDQDDPRAVMDSSNGGVNNGTQGRRRGKTISFVEPEHESSQLELPSKPNEEAELNPVEWIMITRSDPGGSVPRFMVERGTPGGIVSDAVKFLDWACKLDMTVVDDKEWHEGEHEQPRDDPSNLQALETNGHLLGVDPNEGRAGDGQPKGSTDGGIVAPGALTALKQPPINTSLPHSEGHELDPKDAEDSTSTMDSSSIASFATASSGDKGRANGPSGANYAASSHTAASFTTQASQEPSSHIRRSHTVAHEKELSKLNQRKARLHEKLTATRAKLAPAKDDAALAKVEEKHRKETEKQEQRYQSQIEKIERKHEREEQKREEKRRKLEERDERTRLSRERDELKRQLEAAKKQTDELMGSIGQLQSQNTLLAARLGRVDPDALREIVEEKKDGLDKAGANEGGVEPTRQELEKAGRSGGAVSSA